MANEAEIVAKIVELLEGTPLEFKGSRSVEIKSRTLNPQIEAVNGDINVMFQDGEKPVVDYKGIKADVHGMVICQKGIKFDVEFVPGRYDPFYSWEDLRKE